MPDGPAGLARLAARLRALMRPRARAEAEMAEELRLHLEQRVHQHLAAGLSPAEARRAAARQFGAVEPVKAAWRDLQPGAAAGRLGADVRAGVRLFVRRPAFTTAVVLTLGLGIGLTVAIFSAVRTVMLDDLPLLPDRNRLVQIAQVLERALPPAFPAADAETLQASARSFTHLARSSSARSVVRGRGHAERVTVQMVSREYFATLGVAPALGRPIDVDGAAVEGRPVVISDRLWRSQFEADPDVLGQTLRIDRDAWTVVGVMSPRFPPPGWSAEVWLPIGAHGAPPSTQQTLVGRLRPEVTFERAFAEVDAIVRGLQARRPAASLAGGRTLAYDGAHMEVIGAHAIADAAPGLLLLQGIAALLLLVACANVANLLLLHASARRQEIGMRAALGASRGRIVQQLLTEATVLGVAGGLLGVVAARVLVPVVVALDPGVLPRATLIDVGWRDLAAGLALAMVAMFGAAIGPALVVSSAAALAAIRGSARATASRAVRTYRLVLVAAQIAVTVVLVTAAGLLINSFARVVALPLGFDPSGVTAASLTLPRASDEQAEQMLARTHAFLDDIERRIGGRPIAIGSVPYATPAATTNWMIGDGGYDPAVGFSAEVRRASPDYFSTLDVPILRGRTFQPSDTAASEPVAIVNETLAREHGGGRDLLGSRIRTDRAVFTIVGVAADVRKGRLTDQPRAAVYTALAQAPALGSLAIAVRAPDGAWVEREIRAALREFDPDVPLSAIGPLGGLVAEGEARRRFYLLMLSLFGALAVVLAGVGIAGVTAYTTGLRRREISIRLALGAPRATLKAMLVGRGLVPVVGGLGIGLVGAWWTTRVLETNAAFRQQLYEVTAHDPWTFAAAAAAILATGAVACWLPVRRVAKAGVADVLKAE